MSEKAIHDILAILNDGNLSECEELSDYNQDSVNNDRDINLLEMDEMNLVVLINYSKMSYQIT